MGETVHTEVVEAGARHSKSDQAHLQSIHDSANALGAACKMAESDGSVSRDGHERVPPVNLSEDKSSGAAAPVVHSLKLVESAACLETIELREAKADYEIKLIAPGKGATAFYPAEVLQRDGPGVFKQGCHVYLNHPTLAEEAARPEGDVKNLAGVLTSAAQYHEAHAKGPGLYARMKVFADHAKTVEEKAPHVGMSIRARGVAESGQSRDGVPVLKQLTSAESVDVVTRAGAGGMILSESALTTISNADGVTVHPGMMTVSAGSGSTGGDFTFYPSTITSGSGITGPITFPYQPPYQPQGVQMDEAAVKSLVDAAVLAATTPLKERALKGDAQVLAARSLATVSLSESQKQYVIENVLAQGVPLNEGRVDETKLAEAVIAEAKRYGATVSNGARVTGMGVVGMPVQEAAKAADPKPEDINAQSVKTFMRLGLSEAAAKAAVKGRVQ